jgi:thiol-disulfide isomerase/thioredoxin
MISTTHTTDKFRTQARAALRTATTLCAVAVAAGCTSTDTARDNANRANVAGANKPVVTVTQSRGPQQPSPPPAPAPSDTLSAEIMNAEIQTLDGKTLRLADYKNKVVVLNLWATWCGPCRKEIPHMVELNKEYASKGVELIGLTTENPRTDDEKVREFVKTFNINYTIGWARGDLALGLMRGRQTIPQTFVVVPGGRVVAHFPGYSDNLPAMLRAALDKATAD